MATPVLGGCIEPDTRPQGTALADEGSDEADESGTDGGGEEPTLPTGLEMDGAQVVSYSETIVVWRWTGTATPGTWNPQTGPMEAARTAFDVPPGTPFAVEGTLTWPASETRGLGLQILDPVGERLCGDVPPNPFVRQHAYCAAVHPDTKNAARSTVVVDTYLAEQEIEFELVLRLTLGDPATGPVEARSADLNDPSQSVNDAHAVIGFADTGINPYHAAFRDESPEAYQHPSTYIDGYPSDAKALELTLDAPTYADGLGADAEIWESIEPETLYWIPGTKIIGAIIPDIAELETWSRFLCEPMLDCFGHGTEVASRALAEDRSLCTECKMVAAQGFQSGLEWMAEQPWIDLSVIEFCFYPVREGRIGDRAQDDALLERKPTFLPAGNGVESSSVLGMPPTSCHHQGLPNAISVGGHNDGRLVAWSNSLPHIAADLCMDVAHHQAKDAYHFGCGTSFAAPYAAGAAGRLVLEARQLLGDGGGGVSDGVLARGEAGLVTDGPLADGDLTSAELKQVLFATADPRPAASEHDGPICEPVTTDVECLLTQTTPIEWTSIPEVVPQYYFMGYGAITPESLEHGLRVLHGEQPVPERPVEDAFFALDQEARQALVAVDP